MVYLLAVCPFNPFSTYVKADVGKIVKQRALQCGFDDNAICNSHTAIFLECQNHVFNCLQIYHPSNIINIRFAISGLYDSKFALNRFSHFSAIYLIVVFSLID